MTAICAIDPGPTTSTCLHCTFTGDARLLSAPLVLDKILHDIRNEELLLHLGQSALPEFVVIEDVVFYGEGSHVGQSVFHTCRWSGRFEQQIAMRVAFNAACRAVAYLPRQTVKTLVCNNSRAKDQHIRQALIDRFGGPGTKKHPGPLYGISGHGWQALGLAVAYAAQLKNKGTV